ncbi:MAG: RimK family protein [Halieaceae bacterium]|jgi:glutathione synthase/RimK-type ligase-like ATP-grasp enzyme|nr:RimK family protein [Halieaceae bacterium]
MVASRLAIVVDALDDWSPYYPSSDLQTAHDYLASPGSSPRRLVINLCSNLTYRSIGYYVSLLAEARGERVTPSSRCLADLAADQLPSLPRRISLDIDDDEHSVVETVLFGEAERPALASLGRRLFAQLDLPMMRMTLRREGAAWRLAGVEPLSLSHLDAGQETHFASAIDRYSHRIWRKPRNTRRFRYEMAVLIDPREALPPSNRGALRRFRSTGRELGIDVSFIDRSDEMRLGEYDALFIRETTAINHHTWRFARRAEQEGMVVIDDPQSIQRCANKVYLHELLSGHSVPVPRTELLFEDSLEAQCSRLAERLPLVLKIPDGSFSRGMRRVERQAELLPAARDLLGEASVLLAQEYLRTDFDWRIGVLGRRVLFACKYFMSGRHWQIYQHSASGRTRSGGFEPVAVGKVPRAVIKTALLAARLIGDGLYGVDLKQLPDGRVVVMEVNDNPNIDHGVEDAFLGDELYRSILTEFLERLNRR